MQEDFLQFVWLHQYFNASDLRTSLGQELKVIKTGFHNFHHGPDFQEARIRLDAMEWSGSVEIHIKSSDWTRHGHQTDSNYANVVLHVVWENDRPIFNTDNQPIPTLELKGRIRPGLLNRYQQIIESKTLIPCESLLKAVKPITRLSMLEKAQMQRLERKSQELIELLGYNQGDWEETAYQWLLRGFGFKTNAENFLTLAKRLPLKIIQKHSSQVFQVEALLYGQSGLIPSQTTHVYEKKLKKEFEFLRTKYSLEPAMDRNHWIFSRVRPSNFPTVRISQVATFLTAQPHVFSTFSEVTDFKELRNLLLLRQSSHWTSHHDFGKQSKTMIGKMSKTMAENLIINVSVPFLVALYRERQQPIFLEKAQNLLMNMPAEENNVIQKWRVLQWNVSSAFDSQALLELYSNFCSEKRCLSCNIGVELVRNS